MKEHMMIKQQGLGAKLKLRQQGAVAIIVAVCMLFVAVPMLALVLDLGHLYVAKTELQNAADAAALSGAKELNGSIAGIDNAFNKARETAGKNKFNLNSTKLEIDESNIRVGSCPRSDCMKAISTITEALAYDKTFLEVNTGPRNIGTWFAQVMSTVFSNFSASAVAVAGRYVNDVTPIAVCGNLQNPGVTNELGYERGVSYKVSDINPLSNGTMYWIDPESTEPGSCPASNANDSRPYFCTGKIGFTPIVGQYVNTNPGISNNQFNSLDSRFDDYDPQGKCDPNTAPPDTNIQEYIQESSGLPSTWMVSVPNRQGLKFVDSSGGDCKKNENGCKPVPYVDRVANDYGVLWSVYRPDGKTVADWESLYHGNKATANYPVDSSPYAQTSTSSPYFKGTSGTNGTGKPGRRKMNLVILECNADIPTGGGCVQRKVLGIGEFFMQRKASPDNELYLEFGRILPNPLPDSQIRLYK
jgi:hypothetical protein